MRLPSLTMMQKHYLRIVEQQKRKNYLTDENGNFIRDKKGGLILKPELESKKSRDDASGVPDSV